MKYTDIHGDTWEELASPSGVAKLECTQSGVIDYVGKVLPRDEVEDSFGPLVPVPEPCDAMPAGESSGPTVSDVMSRASVYQAAHSLISGLEWPGDGGPNVYDVLQVAKWMEGQN